MKNTVETKKRLRTIEYNPDTKIAYIVEKGNIAGSISKIYSITQENFTKDSSFEIRQGIYYLKNKNKRKIATLWDAELKIVSE